MSRRLVLFMILAVVLGVLIAQNSAYPRVQVGAVVVGGNGWFAGYYGYPQVILFPYGHY